MLDAEPLRPPGGSAIGDAEKTGPRARSRPGNASAVEAGGLLERRPHPAAKGRRGRRRPCRVRSLFC